MYKTGKNFFLINALNERVLLFSGQSYFIKAIETFFPVFAYPDMQDYDRTLEGLGEFSTVMQTLDFVSGLPNCLEFSQSLSCLYQAMQTQKTFFIA